MKKSTIVLYPCATCNLSCKYCFIDKNPSLGEYDKVLANSFVGDYYIDFAKELIDDASAINRVEFWGGEPLLGIERALPVVEKMICEYPNLNEFMLSSNTAHATFIEKLFSIIDVLGHYAEKSFEFHLQVSLDGPPEITDVGRGFGTTEKVLTNLKLLSSKLSNIPQNINLHISFKPTLDSVMLNMLQTIDDIVDYYKFFDEISIWFYDKYPNVKIYPAMFTLANPSCYTKEDGVRFANLCETIRKAESDQSVMNYMKFIREFGYTSFSCNARKRINTDACQGGVCGAGVSILGLLPNDMVCVCHSAFMDAIDSYNELVTCNHGNSTINTALFNKSRNTKMVLHKSEFPIFEQKVLHYFSQGTTARIQSLAELIKALAVALQIDEKYSSDDNAVDAALFMESVNAPCIFNNLSVTGSISTYDVGALKLYLNGAKDVIE